MPFIDIAARFADETGTALLLSGGALDSARYHILGVMPWLTLTGRGERLTVRVSGVDDFVESFTADPLETVRALLRAYEIADADFPFPCAAGLLGYLSYDLKDTLERLPRTSIDDLRLPHIWLTAPTALIVRDIRKKETWLSLSEREYPDAPSPDALHDAVMNRLDGSTPSPEIFAVGRKGFTSNFSKTDYLAAVERIRDYIADGHVYQVNLSQRFVTDFDGHPFSLFRSLYKMNPAPFFAYLNAGDHAILSTSPERFIRLANKTVETRPIKGTRPRGSTEAEDRKMADDLAASPKDDAELSMIVDLLRNDIGKVCKAGSVRVAAHKRIEAYRNVWHLVSVVEGMLDDGKDAVDLIRATFPGGSITGCPKIRAMEIIDELEPNRRHVYTGSIGYISFHGTMDLSIAIRTATVINDRMIFSVGGGIVYDSEPADEYEETLHKGQTLLNAFAGRAPRATTTARWAWFNGRLRLLDDVAIPAVYPGFQYGYGFFETIRVQQGRALRLDAHLRRFEAAWAHLFRSEVPDLTWAEIISQVIAANGLGSDIAAVKLIAAKGDRDAAPQNHTLLVMARRYVHRLEVIGRKGLRLLTYPESRRTPLADHKTLNYLYYLKAGEWARERGGDEAIILNPDDTVSETNSASLLAIDGDMVVRPVSDHMLPGVMAEAVCEILRHDDGFRIVHRPLTVDQLRQYGRILMTNALMGAAPVESIDGAALDSPCDLSDRINRCLFGDRARG